MAFVPKNTIWLVNLSCILLSFHFSGELRLGLAILKDTSYESQESAEIN